jgi:hypothetical protein
MNFKKEDLIQGEVNASEIIKKGEINSWIQGPCRYNLSTQIRNFCVNNGLTIHKMETVPINTSFFGRILDGKMETIYFHVTGNMDSLNILSETLKRFAE